MNLLKSMVLYSIGRLSKDAQEARNKDNNKEDWLLVSSDQFVSSARVMPPKKSPALSSEGVRFFITLGCLRT